MGDFGSRSSTSFKLLLLKFTASEIKMKENL